MTTAMVEKYKAFYRLLNKTSRTLVDRRFRQQGQCARGGSAASGLDHRPDAVVEQRVSYLGCPKRGLWTSARASLPSFVDGGFARDYPMNRCRSFGSVAGEIQRSSKFATLNSDDVAHFKEILGERNVVQDERLEAANSDWMHKYVGSSRLLLLPKSTDEVSRILKYCNSRCLAVVPQGGNTGLVGGSVPVFDEVIINMALMKQVISFDKISGILVCEAGCILEDLISFLDNQGFVMPLDLGAKGSCQIGGNVATNAGGLRLIRYGSLHGNVLGLEVVLANGDVLDMLGTLRKDNTGYDLKHLFIGSEGSLGIITKVSILTPPKLSSVNIAFLACQDYLSCQKLLLEAKRSLGEILSAFEFMDSVAMDVVLNNLDGVRNPLAPTAHNFYVLIETTGTEESYDKEKLEKFLVGSMESGLISDGVLAQDINQASAFWRLREILAQIEPFVYEWTSNHRGSISAEHGVGLMKANKIFYSKSPEAVQLMASIKKLVDPKTILNPYKVLPHSLMSYS
ncbi:unnamed protein product [Linum tenue]|uniref:D-2-hydroxyglutarate dehydrogenase n=1 Tax=Linum tenue TaxID=586396 RepID=A0AAV0I433_9ROSI|nr:unnamed protein product [Linum tenue]